MASRLIHRALVRQRIVQNHISAALCCKRQPTDNDLRVYHVGAKDPTPIATITNGIYTHSSPSRRAHLCRARDLEYRTSLNDYARTRFRRYNRR